MTREEMEADLAEARSGAPLEMAPKRPSRCPVCDNRGWISRRLWRERSPRLLPCPACADRLGGQQGNGRAKTGMVVR